MKTLVAVSPLEASKADCPSPGVIGMLLLLSVLDRILAASELPGMKRCADPLVFRSPKSRELDPVEP